MNPMDHMADSSAVDDNHSDALVRDSWPRWRTVMIAAVRWHSLWVLWGPLKSIVMAVGLQPRRAWPPPQRQRDAPSLPRWPRFGTQGSDLLRPHPASPTGPTATGPGTRPSVWWLRRSSCCYLCCIWGRHGTPNTDWVCSRLLLHYVMSSLTPMMALSATHCTLCLYILFYVVCGDSNTQVPVLWRGQYRQTTTIAMTTN